MTPLTADDLFKLRFVRSARMSPSGDLIASAISRVEDSTERVELFLGTPGFDPAVVEAFGAIRVEAPSWSPTGDSIAISVDGRAHIVDVGTGAISDALTPEGLQMAGEASWSPDGTRLAVSLIEREGLPRPRVIRDYDYRADGRGFTSEIDQGLYEIRLSDRTLRRLVPRDVGLAMQPRWSPVGSEVMFSATHEPVPFASYSPNLSVVDADTGEVREMLSPDRWFISDARWTPDGKRIVFVGARDSTLPIPYTSVWVMPGDRGEPSLRTPGVSAKPGVAIHHDMPAWDLTSHMLVVPRNNEAFVTFQERGSAEIWRIGLDGEPAFDRIVKGDRSCIVLDANLATERLLYAVSDLQSPAELHLASFDGSHERRITAINDDVLADWSTVEIKPYTAVSSDGLEIDAWFLAPTGRSQPLPTVLFIHGGPYSATGHAFRFDLLLLASHGFGVAFSNFRGSAGYGEEHARGIVGSWGENGLPDHLATIERAVKLGFSDSDRLGVWGASHGGFATLWAVTHTNKFRAAVAEASVANFATLYYISDIPQTIRTEMGGSPTEVPDRYRARSPITYIDRCSTPTMLVHGEHDLRCPISEAEQAYRGLLDADCPTELVRLADADHLGDSNGPIDARRGQNEALLRWFTKYLQ